MSKERLIIKNFFTLKEVDIELGKYNVFIGEQASGKSLLIKTLFFFRSILFTPIRMYRTDSEELQKLFVHLFCDSLGIDNFNFNASILYQVADHQIKITISEMDDNILISYNKSLTNLYTQSRQLLLNKYKEIQQNEAYIDVIRFSIMEMEVQRAVENSALGKISFVRFLPAGRMSFFTILNNLFNVVSNEKFNLNQLIVNFGQDYQKAFSDFNNLKDDTKHRLPIFNELSDTILKGKYVYDKLGGYIQQNGFQTKLVDGSSGQQEFLPVYMILRHYLLSGHDQGNLYIEEPEAHLFPSAQKALTELLIYVTNVTNGNSLNITTHSPYILTVLNNLILANDVKDKQTLFDKDLLVPFEEIRAYNIINGQAQDLRDTENRLITAENLDKVSEQTALDFDKLLDLKYE
ncbi:MAG: hypothetical protein E6Q33_07735 [Neisseriales bacterium]|nr:MAG: hypothetical protein E6Q33_07735 [Neisseriales bacterium]